MIKLKPNSADTLELLRKEQARRLKFYEHNGSLFQSDPASIQAMAARCSLAPEVSVIPWVDAQNSIHEISAKELISLATSIAERNDKIYAAASAMKVKLKAGVHVDPESEKNWEID